MVASSASTQHPALVTRSVASILSPKKGTGNELSMSTMKS